MDDVKVENVPYNVIPVTEYDPFEAKFAASLYWLVFRATEDGEFDNIPSQVTSPIQRDSEKRITVRPEVTEFLTNGVIYCKVCDSIFDGKVPVAGHWALLQTLSRHGFYVVEEGDIAVTDSALQQKKPFRKSTHLALMDCLMNAFSARMVSVQQVVQSVSTFSSFNASKELPFDLEDALLLWMNKICTALNENQLKKQKQHAEQLLQNQDKAKRFRFRRDQLQPKVQIAFPMMEELLKDISDGKSLLGIIMFYHPTVINIEDVRFDKDLSTEDCVRNLDLFRSLCSQLICTSVLALKVEDLLYGSQAMKPNVIALLAEIFHKCEIESLASENGVEKQTSKSDVDLRYIVANKENVVDNQSSSAPVLSSDKLKFIERGSPRESFKSERSSSISGQINSSTFDPTRQENSYVWKTESDSQVNANNRMSFKSPFHLDFTIDNDLQQPLSNGPLPKQGNDNEKDEDKDKENPFSGILQKPVLTGDSRKHNLRGTLAGGYGSPRTTPRQEVPLLMRRNKQKQRTLDLEEWDMQQEEVEDKSILQRYLQELQLNDLQRSQSLTGLDKAKVEPRQSFHAWREDTGASLSDTNLPSSRNERISLDFKPNPTSSVPQRAAEGTPQRGTQGIHVPVTSSGLKAKRDEHTSQDSLSSSPKSTESLNTRPSGDKARERQQFVQSVVRDSVRSDISAKELNQFEELEAMILAGKSVETPRKFVRGSKLPNAPASQDDEDELNTSVSSEDMNKFRLEVLQRLTEDKLREIPDGAEMEDDDDPILLARNNAVSSPRNPPEQRTGLDVPDPPAEVPTDQLSPITETTEPCPSVASNPNSVSSANSTAPSSPCSPLDVAPFMPAFFTTSPANTLDRKKQRLKEREDSERTLVAEDDGAFTSEPETSVTPRFQTMPPNKYRDFTTKSKSFEQLARGSYTVSQVSVESAQAAGIPVINASAEETRARVESSSSQSAYPERSDSRKLIQQETNSSGDLSGLRPLVLSSGGGESNEAFPAEAVDGRRDSLESSPLPSPAFTRGKRDSTREKRDDTRQDAAFRPGDTTAQDSPGDVVIFERSSSNAHGVQEDTVVSSEGLNSQTTENRQRDSVTISRAKKSEAYVFDFNQEAVQHYENDPVAQDFKTYKKGKPADLADNSNLPQGHQAFQGSQRDGQFATFGKNGHIGTQEHRPVRHSATKELDEIHSRHAYEEHPSASVCINDLRESDGFSTYRKETKPLGNNGAAIAEATEKGLNLRHSDGFSTFRKKTEASASESLLAQFRTIPFHDHKEIATEQFATFAKSAIKHDGRQFRAVEELYHPPELDPPAVTAARPLPSRGGEGQMYTTPRGGEEEQVRVSGSSNITRSRTFRKKPDGQIIEVDDTGRSSSPRQYEENISTNRASKPTGQQSVNTHIRASPEGAGSDNPHTISWTDESEAGARLMRHPDASVDRSTNQESPGPSSPRRRGSPRQTGRGSPGARISWLTAAKSGVGGQVMLNDKGEIDETPDEVEDEKVVTSQIAYLRMQLEEKRRHIEAEKYRAQAEWEDQRRRLGQTAFWYVIGKAQGSKNVGEGTGSEATHVDKAPQSKPRKPVAEFPNQPSPPIAWSSPANSPLPSSVSKPSPSDGPQFETREFRLSDYPPGEDLDFNQDVMRPSSQPAVEVSSRPAAVPPRPFSHDPAASRQTAPARRCWDVDVAQVPTPPPLVYPDTASMSGNTKQEHNVVDPPGGGGAEIEVEIHTPTKKGLAMFIGDDAQSTTQGLTPEQERKREKFMRLRQKKQEEDKTRKEAELEKKRRREEKQREKEMLQKMEEDRLRQEELDRQKAEKELRMREAQAARVPDSYSTYRRPGPRQHVYDVDDDSSNCFVPAPAQPSGFAEFSGPQCYVKPSGKSNRKIIVNAISHVCLSGTVNQDQKEKCLQAISESDGHHFMILFKDGLKFRGIYVHNLENDQLFKIFGIGPRVVTSKMLEGLYKYNSGGKEFTKIPSKTLSIAVDGLAIQKSYWQSGKPVVQSKTSSNLKRPPRHPQR